MTLELPLEKLLLDTKGSKYTLVLRAAERAKLLKEQKKDLDPKEKMTMLALDEVLREKYTKQQKQRDKEEKKK
ncbi:MAG: DNA-directed RNA polymerase subunit omega [bacterium]